MILVFRGEAAVGNFSQDVNQPLGDTQDSTRMGEHPESGRYSTQPVSMSVSQSSRGKEKRSNSQLEVLGRFANGLQKIGDAMYEKEEEKKGSSGVLRLPSIYGRYNIRLFHLHRCVVSSAYDYIIKSPKIGDGFLRRSSEERAHWFYCFMKQHKLD